MAALTGLRTPGDFTQVEENLEALVLYQPNMPKFTTERLDFAAQAEPERHILAVSGRIAVSPGLTSRPSLSAPFLPPPPLRGRPVSPGLTSRPSLSDPQTSDAA